LQEGSNLVIEEDVTFTFVETLCHDFSEE